MSFGGSGGFSAETLLMLGLIAGGLSIFAYLPYIRDTYWGDTKPQKASWLVWSVLSSISFFGQWAEGAGPSLWFAGVQVSGTLTIFLMSVFLGKGPLLSRSDLVVLVFAGIGMLTWVLTDNAAYALGISITISLTGGSATVAKAYRSPDSETSIKWIISFFASIFAISSVGALDPLLLAYPVYLLILNGAIVIAIFSGRAQIARQTLCF